MLKPSSLLPMKFQAVVRLMFSLFLLGCTDGREENSGADRVIQPKTVQSIDAVKDLRQQRVSDLVALAIALEKYKQDNRSYPISTGSGQHSSNKKWDSVVDSSGAIIPNWIEGLAPEYISSLPVDPRRDNIVAHQYVYKSDGAHYKLVALNPDDCRSVKRVAPELIDRHRGGCVAYGFWTYSARKWK